MTEPAADLHRAVGLGVPGYRRDDIARLAGIDRTRSVKWWRAMGFPEVPEDVVAFSDDDVEIVKRLTALSGAGLIEDDAILRLARLLGASFSRIAEAQLEVVEELAAALRGGRIPVSKVANTWRHWSQSSTTRCSTSSRTRSCTCGGGT